jgi:pentalenolactone synthase
MEDLDQCPALQFDRPDVLGIPPMYLRLQADQSLARVRTPAGDLAWLVTRHDDARLLFAHESLGRSHPDPENAPRFTMAPMLGGPIGDSQTERAEHQRMRRALGSAFSVARLRALRPRIQTMVDDLLEDLAGSAQPADLHEAFSFPLPVQVICEMLGIPYARRDDFRRWSDGAIDMRDPKHAAESIKELTAYMSQLIAEKRIHPGEDVITDLISADNEGTLSEQDVVQFAFILLLSGHETTVTRIDFGALLLMVHPEERDRLLGNPDLIGSAVEEVVRMSQPGVGLLPRYAQADVTVGDVTIASGDLVLIATGAANRDPLAFAEPERFDISRGDNQHVAFGYGPRSCLGASLARIELQCALSSLFQRFPSLQLASPMGSLRLRDHLYTGGVDAMLVNW